MGAVFLWGKNKKKKLLDLNSKETIIYCLLGIRAGSRGSLSLSLGLSHRANEELRQTAPSLMRYAASTSKNNI
jgi:hypothetical protein